jgi:hypothetical protein
VYVIKIKRFVDLTSFEMYDESQFQDRLFPNPLRYKSAFFAYGGKRIDRLTYRPAEPAELSITEEDGVSAVNTYRASTLKRTFGGDVRPWLELVDHVFPDRVARDHFLKWCAHHLQQPDIKINHALFLGGVQGVGKDALIVPITAATGEHNTGIITQLDLDTNQNDYLLNHRLIIGQELIAGNSWRTLANKLKPYLADPPSEVRINRKQIPQFDVPNIANWIFLTNSETPLAT